MLVLTRRVGQEIVIDGGINVKLLEIKNGRIRLGIDAPRQVVVDRGEVHERRQDFDSMDSPACETGIDDILLSVQL